MKEQFTQFIKNISLTDEQWKDAKTKYDGVCKKLHSSYYDSQYDGKTKYLFGSYKTETNIRPIKEFQDVDVIFKIPEETYKKFRAYESNGASALLQEIRGYLKDKYPNTEDIKAWGKVVLVKFAENYHNVEVLPAYENSDKTFMIPNSEDGGDWEKFDARSQYEEFNTSNQETKALTRDLTKMIKTWVNKTASLNYKSFALLTDVMEFLKSKYKNGAEYSDYQFVVKDYFVFLSNKSDSNIDNYVQTALLRAKKAIKYFEEDKLLEATEEWRKIFGNESGSDFPKVSASPVREIKSTPIIKPSAPYASYSTNK